MIRTRVVAAALALATAFACGGGDPILPRSIEGSYVLETHAGRRGGPWTRVLTGGHTYRLDSATLVVRGDGNYQYNEYVRHFPLDRPAFDSRVQYDGAYARVGNVFKFATDGVADACTANCYLASFVGGVLSWTSVEGWHSTFRRRE